MSKFFQAIWLVENNYTKYFFGQQTTGRIINALKLYHNK